MAKPEPAAPPSKPSGLMTALAFLSITLIAAGAGAAHGLRAMKPPETAPAAMAAPADPHGDPKAATASLMRELPPIVTTLAEPKAVWIRLETAIVLDRAALPDADKLTREITGDVLAFVRTLSLPQLQGASGLHHLREDLNERAAIRSKGRVREVVVQGLVLQ